jgi:hypothetical protein
MIIFVSAEKMAKKLGIPRSRLFTGAIEELQENHSEEECKKSGSVPIYRVIKTNGIQPVLVVYVS